ncbi:MAG: lamin tail domain-containing protein [Bacteroidetes bacterium]|nr:lamin tail domain-containing protein [Bacteroidota bacterium]
MKTFLFYTLFAFPFILFGATNSEHHFPTATSTTSTILITEIMADPDPSNGVPPAEYIEILNTGQAPVNLAGWVVFDGSAKQLPALTINTGEYMIICSNSDTTYFAGVWEIRRSKFAITY